MRNSIKISLAVFLSEMKFITPFNHIEINRGGL